MQIKSPPWKCTNKHHERDKGAGPPLQFPFTNMVRNMCVTYSSRVIDQDAISIITHPIHKDNTLRSGGKLNLAAAVMAHLHTARYMNMYFVLFREITISKLLMQ